VGRRGGVRVNRTWIMGAGCRKGKGGKHDSKRAGNRAQNAI